MSNNNGKKSVQPQKPTFIQKDVKAKTVERMQRKLADKKPDKKICLAMIVRNEEKNMVRLLDSVKPIIDMISIDDTGSEDKTIEVIEKWGKENNIPTKVHKEP